MTVSSLSTVVNALMRSGGPSAAGSFRNVQLRRGREVVTSVDLYDLLLKGDRSADRVMQADDVIYVGPVGPQVALIGSVNQPAIFEIKPGETINDLLQMAGGFATVADTHAAWRSSGWTTATPCASRRSNCRRARAPPLRNGDVLRAFNSTSVALAGAAAEQARARRRRGGAAGRIRAAAAIDRVRRAARRRRPDPRGLRVRHRVQPRERAHDAARELRARTARPRDRIRARPRRPSAPARPTKRRRSRRAPPAPRA